MAYVNENFLRLQDSYLFANITKKVNNYIKDNPEKKIIKLGIGDVTLPIPKCITKEIKSAAEEMERKETFKGYGPEQGYLFLREKITIYDYLEKGILIKPEEVFVSDGAKCDTGNIVDLFSNENTIAISNPVYPVYLDTNIMSGRKVIYIKGTEENDFEPLPNQLKEVPDIIYLCSPNNPTGTAYSKENLKKWVDYAIENNSIILYDAAYEAFITQENIPHSIYEIEGAKQVAIEFKSFSKTAGFTGLRCAYTVIPLELKINSRNR